MSILDIIFSISKLISFSLSDHFSTFHSSWLSGPRKWFCGDWICVTRTCTILGHTYFPFSLLLLILCRNYSGKPPHCVHSGFGSSLTLPHVYSAGQPVSSWLGPFIYHSPRAISYIFTDYAVIPSHSCMAEMFFIHIMGGVEMVLLIARHMTGTQQSANLSTIWLLWTPKCAWFW